MGPSHCKSHWLPLGCRTFIHLFIPNIFQGSHKCSRLQRMHDSLNQWPQRNSRAGYHPCIFKTVIEIPHIAHETYILFTCGHLCLCKKMILDIALPATLDQLKLPLSERWKSERRHFSIHLWTFTWIIQSWAFVYGTANLHGSALIRCNKR